MLPPSPPEGSNDPVASTSEKPKRLVLLTAVPVAASAPSPPPVTAPPIAAAPTENAADEIDDSSASRPSKVMVPAARSPVDGSSRTPAKVTPTVSSFVV
jgi:hypothetical protein